MRYWAKRLNDNQIISSTNEFRNNLKDLTLKFPDSTILNHSIIVASFVEKGATLDKPI